MAQRNVTLTEAEMLLLRGLIRVVYCREIEGREGLESVDAKLRAALDDMREATP